MFQIRFIPLYVAIAFFLAVPLSMAVVTMTVTKVERSQILLDPTKIVLDLR